MLTCTKDDKVEIYLYPPCLFITTTNKKSLISLKQKRLSHPNFLSLKQHLKYLIIDDINDFDRYIYNNCQKTIATKIYNCYRL